MQPPTATPDQAGSGVISRREAALVSLVGGAIFLICCVVARGGVIDSAPFGDAHLYGHYAFEMTSGRWPYRDFFDEYPPLAQPLFLLVRLLPGSFTVGFKWTMALCGVAALVLMVATLASVGVSRLRLVVAAAAAAVSPVIVGPVFLNTYDLFPAALTAGALLAFVQRRERLLYVLLALAVAAKIYPIVLLPLALIESERRGGRELVRRGLAWFFGVLVAVHLPFAIMGPGGLRFTYWVQLKRGLEVESLGGSVLLLLDRLGVHSVVLRDEAPGSKDVVGSLATAVGIVSSLVLVAAVLAVAWLYLRRRASPLVAAAAAVTAFVAFSKVFSPQYVDWLVPLVPAAGVVEAVGLVVIYVFTRLVWNRFVTGQTTTEDWGHVLAWWVFARDVLVVALYAVLFARLAGVRAAWGSRLRSRL
jgi:uncharacterized membrane protein